MNIRALLLALPLVAVMSAGCSRTLIVTDDAGGGPSASPTVTSGSGRIRQIWRDGGTPLIRTDFTDDLAWQRITTEIAKPVDDFGDDGYAPHVVPLEDTTFEGATGSTLANVVASLDDAQGEVILADQRSMKEAAGGGEVTLAYVDLALFEPGDEELFDSFRGRTFRTTVPQIASIEANLSISNMDFSDFANSVESDGVFRGTFPDPE